MYFLHVAKRIEPFYSRGRLEPLLAASPFEHWRVERRGVLLWMRLRKGGGSV